MSDLFSILAIQELEGGTYTIETILNIIKQLTNWGIAIGLSIAGIAFVISFITLMIVDADQKPRVKSKIVQIFIGIGGIILAISLVNITIRLFA